MNKQQKCTDLNCKEHYGEDHFGYVDKEQEIRKRRYSQEMLLMTGCPNCGQEINREFVEMVIDEIIDQAIKQERQRIVDELKNCDATCPEAYGFEGRETFPNCGDCIICKLVNDK